MHWVLPFIDTICFCSNGCFGVDRGRGSRSQGGAQYSMLTMASKIPPREHVMINSWKKRVAFQLPRLFDFLEWLPLSYSWCFDSHTSQSLLVQIKKGQALLAYDTVPELTILRTHSFKWHERIIHTQLGCHLQIVWCRWLGAEWLHMCWCTRYGLSYRWVSWPERARLDLKTCFWRPYSWAMVGGLRLYLRQSHRN